MTARRVWWRTREAPAPAAAMLAAAAATAFSYWPGLMTWDAIRQYGQAIDGAFDDWHPPAMEWLWRQLTAIHSGPAPMLVLQLALYWGGFALLAAWALRGGRARLAAALGACGLLPLGLALMGAVLKDCLMAGALVAATGLLLWGRSAIGPRARIAVRALAILLLLAAATLRFNAFLACLPLLVALMPAAFRANRLRLAATTLVATLALVAAMPLVNRALDVDKSGVELSLVIFDLGGITEHSGVDVFPPLGVANPVAVNHGCYSPIKWDPYSFWVDPLCPLGFAPFKAFVDAHHVSPYRLLIAAVLQHPIAYAEHRLAHFNINTRFLVHDEIERPVQVESAPNDWGYRVTPNAVLATIDALAVASAHTPLGWPIAYVALALGVLLLSPALTSRATIVPIALSSMLYGLGYGVFSVAVELRYHLWTMLGALIACVLAASDLATIPAVPRRRLGYSLAPVLAVTAFALLWRLLPAV